jgi:hypothetical protein
VIYAIRAVGTEYVKFGKAAGANVQERLRAMQIGCPLKLEFVAVGEGGYKEERQIHLMLKAADKHHAGEWFVMSQEVEQAIQWIKNRSKPFPELPPLKPGAKRHRLARMTEHALDLTRALEKSGYKPREQDPIKRRQQERMEWWKTKKPRTSRQSASPISRQKSFSPSSTEPSKATEKASLFIASLMDWESNTLRSIANSLSTESLSGVTQRSQEPSLN